jgi:nitrate reductase gamma subunit
VKTTLLFSVVPYVSAALFAVGTVRLLAVALRQSGRSGAVASPPLDRGAWLGLVPWAVLFAGHLVALGMPASIRSWDEAPGRLYVLEGAGLACGLLVFGAWSAWARRHLARSARLSAELLDSAFLGLLFVGVVTGLAIAALYRWGSAWSTATLSPYVRSLSSGAPQVELVRQMPFLVQLHVFSAFAALAIAPLTTPAARLARAVVALRPRAPLVPPVPSEPTLGDSHT